MFIIFNIVNNRIKSEQYQQSLETKPNFTIKIFFQYYPGDALPHESQTIDQLRASKAQAQSAHQTPASATTTAGLQPVQPSSSRAVRVDSFRYTPTSTSPEISRTTARGSKTDCSRTCTTAGTREHQQRVEELTTDQPVARGAQQG